MTGTMSRASLSSPYISETTTSSLLEVKTALRREEGGGGDRGRCFIDIVHFLTFVGLPTALIYSIAGNFCGENFRRLLTGAAKRCHAPKFRGENFQ